MTVITISRGSKSMGRAVAEQVAERLGYQCLSRGTLLDASQQYDIPEVELARAMTDAPGVLERLGHRKQSYVAFVRSALARHASQDDIVYHGHAGHVLLKNVSHVLKVRIVAAMDKRVDVVMREESLSEAEALHAIERVDKGRTKWTKTLFGVDPSDANLYDLVANITRFGVSDAVDLICHSAQLPQFATTRDSQRAMDDLVIACDVKAALVDEFADISVACNGGNVLVYCGTGERHRRKVRTAAEALQGKIDGLRNLEVHAGATPPSSAV